jgi:hypothetical protein
MAKQAKMMVAPKTGRGKNAVARLHFDVSTGLKRVIGRDLITDDEVAIFELVKNSFDAGASNQLNAAIAVV